MSKRDVRSAAGPTGWLNEYGPYALVVFVAAATAFLVILAFNRPLAPSTPATIAPTASPSSSDSASAPPTATPTPETTPTPTPTPTPTVAFLGDSYTLGLGASQASTRWTSRLAAANDWAEVNFGAAQTGYGTFGQGAESFSDRVSQVIAAQPAIVIVSGGRFDFAGTASASAVSTAIAETFKALRTGLPDARIIATGPIWSDTNPPSRILDIGREVREAVERENGSFIDIGQPLVSQPNLLRADGLPNDAGYEKLGAVIASEIAPLLAVTD